ncbi:MAG: dienelactone hydrolase family protein [Bacteroidales bacterium]|nr:dienelactone hydrolase family protein [Bacteroidales bacterium]
MNLKFLGFIIYLPFLINQLGNSQESQILSKPDIVPAVHGILEKPQTLGTYPSVIILYGGSGWRPQYISIAKKLADSGFVVLVLDYYAETVKDTGQTDIALKWPQWQAMIRSAVTFLQEDSSTKKGSVGLIGYSQGAFLAVSTATSIPEVRAVVDYFGGGSSKKDDLESEVRNFPPLLILHGEKDNVVPVSMAYSLRDAVIAQGGEVEMKIYINQPHGFNAIWSPYYSESDDIDSFRRTVDFLRRKLRD